MSFLVTSLISNFNKYLISRAMTTSLTCEDLKCLTWIDSPDAKQCEGRVHKFDLTNKLKLNNS